MSEALGEADYPQVAEVLDLRVDGVVGAADVDLAFLEFELRPQMFQDLTSKGASVPQANAVLDAYFGELSSTLADPSRIDELVELFTLNDGAAQAYARWGNQVFDANGNLVDDLVEAGAACRVANSFSGDTLVAFADGTMLPIVEVQVGDQVLAYDFDTGTTVARQVTATLPHSDWLLEAHLSDGSVLEVTEDHRFWSITDDAWVELQDLDTTDQLLTPHGATVTVDYLDLHAGVTAPAWDLTVAEEHNFFVAAGASAETVLVHNATRKATCDLPFSAGQSDVLRAVDDLASDLRESLETVVGDLTELGVAEEDVIRFVDFASSNPERVRPQLEAWPNYVPLASGIPDGPVQGGAAVVDGVVVADVDALAAAVGPPVGSRLDGNAGLATRFGDGEPEVTLINSRNVNDNGYLTNGGQARVLEDGRLFGFDGGFPDHSARFEMVLDQDTVLSQIAAGGDFDRFRGSHFRDANNVLANMLDANPDLGPVLGVSESAEQIRGLGASGAPGGFTWHHHQEFGRVQLVPAGIHAEVRHTGGIALWPRLADYLGLS